MNRYDADGDFIMYTDNDPIPDSVTIDDEELDDDSCLRMSGFDPYDYFDGPIESLDDDDDDV